MEALRDSMINRGSLGSRGGQNTKIETVND